MIGSEKEVIPLDHSLGVIVSEFGTAMGLVELLNRSGKPVNLFQKLDSRRSYSEITSKNIFVTILEDGTEKITLPPEGQLAAVIVVPASGAPAVGEFLPFAKGSFNVIVTVINTFKAPDGKEYSSGDYEFTLGRFLRIDKPTSAGIQNHKSISVASADSEPFVIKDENLLDRTHPHVEGEVSIHPDEDGAFRFVGKVLITMKSGKPEPALWVDGMQHTWVGRFEVKGYVFDSDESEPLQFKVDKGRGYVYLKGKGTVTLPNKESVTLPKIKAASIPVSQPADSSAQTAANSRSWKANADGTICSGNWVAK